MVDQAKNRHHVREGTLSGVTFPSSYPRKCTAGWGNLISSFLRQMLDLGRRKAEAEAVQRMSPACAGMTDV